jgi:O-antigen/teichoic acid export membrane protein
MIKFAAVTWPGTVAGILLVRIDQMLLGSLSDFRQVGLYAAAVAVGEIPLIMTAASRDVLLTHSAQGRNTDQIAKVNRVTLLGVIAISLLIASVLWLMFPIIFGPPFQDAILAAYLILVNSVISAPGVVAGSALVGLGYPWSRSLFLVGGSVLNLVLLVLLAQAWGATGAALATLFAGAFMTSLIVQRYTKLTQSSIIAFTLPRREDARSLLQLRPRSWNN